MSTTTGHSPINEVSPRDGFDHFSGRTVLQPTMAKLNFPTIFASPEGITVVSPGVKALFDSDENGLNRAIELFKMLLKKYPFN